MNVKGRVFLLLCLTFLMPFVGIGQQGPDPVGGKYDGKMRQGLRHGRGTCVWEDGSRYEGMWREGLMHGKGTMTYQGHTYVGDWEFGVKSGRGTLTFPDKSSYTGEFKNNKMEGYGTLKFSNGNTHTGMWKNNMANGYGKHNWVTGAVYIGNWKDNLMHGDGTLVYADGRVEQGTFKDNKFVPCDCKAMPTVEESYRSSVAVFVGKVVSIYSESGNFDEVIMEIQQYWKGEFGFGRRVFVKAPYTSCDMIFYEGESYLIYALTGDTEGYYTTRCTRSTNLTGASFDLAELPKVAVCQDNSVIKPGFASNEADFVCGCDGVTYRNPSRANKAGITSWKVGRCP
jgi:hypothetical protein